MDKEKKSDGINQQKINEEMSNIEMENLKKAEKIMEEKDRESKFRKCMASGWMRIVATISIVFVFYHIYTSGFGMPMAYKHRIIHLAFVLTLVYILYPARKGSIMLRPSVVDIILTSCTIGTAVYMYYSIDIMANRAGVAVPMDYFVGFIGIMLVLEACRRVIGYQLLTLTAVMLLYAYFGRYIPGVLSHQGYTIKRLIYQLYLTTQGIFGIPMGVSAEYMVLFVFFASILANTGMGKLFNDVSIGIAGRSPGGPAKVAVISSGLMGMINGGAAANVATTGALTIPLMKRIGYKSHFAGAVEAAASTGGQIMPPIMGTVAFIMSEFTGIPYIKIAAAATIPAVLYFASVYFAVDFRAKNTGLTGMDASEIPDYMSSVKKYWHMLLPIFLLVYLLMTQHSAMYSAFYSLIATLVLSFIKASTRMNSKQFFEVIIEAARSSLSVAVAMATAGIVIGILAITGLGLIIADNILILSGGKLFIILILVMFVSIILGMGLPTSACYVIATSICAAILRDAGVAVLQANMFILYYACLSTITPPVALASYVAAGISGANPNKVGWTAFRLAIAGFIIPFFFIYSPEMLLVANTKMDILIAATTAFIGVYLLAAASEGYYTAKINIAIRVILLIASISLIKPGIVTDILGIGLALLVYVYIKLSNRMVKDVK